jgi:hypothetical protein
VVPCRRISAVFQFLCFEHLLHFFESWRAWAASIERHSRLGTFAHAHQLIYIDSISKIIIGLNNLRLLQATLISTKGKLFYDGVWCHMLLLSDIWLDSFWSLFGRQWTWRVHRIWKTSWVVQWLSFSLAVLFGVIT